MIDKIGWDTYFMSIAYLSSVRSSDPHTKHGCVIVSPDNKIISIGYNGAASKIPNEKVPATRPDKYFYYIHAELNSILNAGKSLENSIFYITGIPCPQCASQIIQVNASKIVYGPKQSASITPEIKKHIDFIIKESKIEYMEFKNMNEVKKLVNII